jgi:hypothetical protein
MRFPITINWRSEMKLSSNSRLILACFGLLSAAVSPAALAEFKCEQKQLTRVDAHACALGAKDVAALRRHVTMTQAIYGLQMKDYVRFVGDEPLTPQVKMAPAPQAPKPAAVAGVAPPSR